MYTETAIGDVRDLVYGLAPRPVKTRRGLEIGEGHVYPELNFTLPPMALTEESFPEVRRHYQEIVQGALTRAAALDAEGVVLEFETLPPMTENPSWAAELCKVLLDGIADAHARTGLKAALRMTPNDIREMVRPPLMRQGPRLNAMLTAFERCAELGADLLSIESVGGKEVHDDALMSCSLPHVIFALCSLGVRDMDFLWTHIVEIARRHGVVPAGDTACGFGNTAMVLAEQGMIPRVFAAVVRAISAVRSLRAYCCGALGPGKDCGYENPILKAITGCPMSMEGKTAACAHFSPLGNIAAATCDLWSNESVQNIRLLAGMAPVCYLEQLVYDCRLFNKAAEEGADSARTLQKWLVSSDVHRDPQAYILAPDSALALGRAIVEADTPYTAGLAAAGTAITLMRRGIEYESLRIEPREQPYLDRMEASLGELPDSEETFIEMMLDQVDTSKFHIGEYGL